MKNFGLFLSALFLCSFLAAQDSTSLLKPYSFEVTSGFSLNRTTPLGLGEMKQIAPGSVLLNKDYSDFNAEGYYMRVSNANTVFSAQVQFVPYSKKKKTRLWYTSFHIGFSYADVQFQGPSYVKEAHQRFDTLVAADGTNFYLDSVNKQYAQFSWAEKLIGIDIGQVFHTNDQHIFSFWTGYGIQLAMGFDTRFDGNFTEMKYNTIGSSYNPNTNTYTTFSGDPGTYDSFKTETETIRTKSVFVPRIYFPLGMQIRFSRKPTFWNKLALTFEARMSLDIQPLPNSITITRTSVYETAGLKYYFANNASK
jgi:hypothetical protein